MRIICDAMGGTTPHDQQFIKSVDWDVDTFGRAQIETSADRTEAIQFDGFNEAFAFYKTQSIVRPLRPDGEANRPLTAYTVAVE